MTNLTWLRLCLFFFIDFSRSLPLALSREPSCTLWLAFSLLEMKGGVTGVGDQSPRSDWDIYGACWVSGPVPRVPRVQPASRGDLLTKARNGRTDRNPGFSRQDRVLGAAGFRPHLCFRGRCIWKRKQGICSSSAWLAERPGDVTKAAGEETPSRTFRPTLGSNVFLATCPEGRDEASGVASHLFHQLG